MATKATKTTKQPLGKINHQFILNSWLPWLPKLPNMVVVTFLAGKKQTSFLEVCIQQTRCSATKGHYD